MRQKTLMLDLTQMPEVERQKIVTFLEHRWAFLDVSEFGGDEDAAQIDQALNRIKLAFSEAGYEPRLIGIDE